MDRQIFQRAFERALSLRADALRDRHLEPWFQGRGLPPVIGFGLPAGGDAKAPLATIALNPSGHEFPGCLPATDDLDAQWAAQTSYFGRSPYRAWFDLSDAVVGALTTGSRSHYGTVAVPHLDLLALPTAGPFDRTYDDRSRTPEQRSAAQRLLRDGSRQLLLVLANLIVCHGLTHAIVYGYVPPRRGGSRTNKDTFGGFPIFRVDEVDSVAQILVGRGGLHAGHEAVRAVPDLARLTLVFLSKGPSSGAGAAALRTAAQRVRERAWLPPAAWA